RPSSGVERRSLLRGAGATAIAGIVAVAGVPTAAAAAAPGDTRSGDGTGGLIRVERDVYLHVADLNGGSRGTLVFVAGLPLGSNTFEYQLNFFAEKGYRAIGIDGRGFGRSSAPFGPYDYDVWAADVGRVLRAMRLRNVTLIGHSMGGAIALRHAASKPNRVARLVLAAAAAPKLTSGPAADGIRNLLDHLLDVITTNRPEVAKALAPNFFSTHTDLTTDIFLQEFTRQSIV